MSRLRIGDDGSGDIVIAAHVKNGDYEAFYLSTDGKYKNFANSRIAYESIEKELTEKQINIIFDVIRELLNES